LQTVLDREAGTLRHEKKWGNDWIAGTDLVLCWAVFAKHVGIEFWRGSTLPDPAGIVEGTGKNLRHVKLRTIEDARSRALRELVRAAIRADRDLPKRTR
jgi:hypothetical protein